MTKINAKRILSFFIVCVVIVSALIFTTSCGGSKYQTDDTRVVMKLGGYDITYDEYRYLYMNHKKEILADDSIAEGDLDRMIKEKVEQTLRNIYSINAVAKKYGVSLSKSEKKELQAAFSAFIKNTYGDRESFLAEAKEYYLTEQLTYKLKFCDDWLSDKVFMHVTDEASMIILASDKTIEEDIWENFYAATQILITFNNGNSKENNRLKIQEAYEQVLAGQDFNSLIEQYGEDEMVTNGKVRYDTVDGSVVPEFEKAALALQVGEISEIVESSMGFHIIKRMPLEEDYINKNFEELRDLYFVREFNYIVKDIAKNMAVEKTEVFDEINISTMK